jgi:hypothetical protein
MWNYFSTGYLNPPVPMGTVLLAKGDREFGFRVKIRSLGTE